MRTRDLKPGFFKNESLAALPALTRLLYQGLWLMADREGRLLDNTKLISADVFPYENVNVERGLTQLASGDDPFIVRYQADGKRCIWLPKFLKNQRPHPHEVASQLPPCPAETPARSLQSNDAGQPMSRPDPPHSLTVSQSSDLATSDLSSSPASVHETPRERRERLKPLLNLTTVEWSEVHTSFPERGDINARFMEWVDWIGESEGERWPKKGNRLAFEGFLKKKRDVTYVPGGGNPMMLREVAAL